MRLPWHDLPRDKFERLVFELLEKIGFERRVFLETGPRSPEGHDIVAYRENEILPDTGYPEKWLVVPIPHQPNPITVENIEFVKKWADEPYHEVDYVLLVSSSKVSPEVEEWITKFNRFPIKKYKVKLLGKIELEQLVCSSEALLNEYFGGFQPKELDLNEEKEIEEVVTKKILNFRSDLGIVDIYLNILFTFLDEKQKEIINKIATVWSFDGFERLKRWNSGWVLIRLAKIKPELLPLNIVREVALKGESIYRAQAAHIYAWLSVTMPEAVDPIILGKMLEIDSDYFVSVPVTKAIVRLIQSNEATMSVLLGMLKDESYEQRKTAARIIYALADENPMMVPKSVCDVLLAEESKDIQEIGKKTAEKLLSFWEAPLRAEFKKAREEFEKKNYARAQFMFENLSKKSEFSLAPEALWWSGYCLYLQRDYAGAIREFSRLEKDEKYKATAAWWLSIVYEKKNMKEESVKKIHFLSGICSLPEVTVKIAPEREMYGIELKPLLFKRLRELNGA